MLITTASVMVVNISKHLFAQTCQSGRMLGFALLYPTLLPPPPHSLVPEMIRLQWGSVAAVSSGLSMGMQRETCLAIKLQVVDARTAGVALKVTMSRSATDSPATWSAYSLLYQTAREHVCRLVLLLRTSCLGSPPRTTASVFRGDFLRSHGVPGAIPVFY